MTGLSLNGLICVSEISTFESLLLLSEQLSLRLETESRLYKAATKNSDRDHWLSSDFFKIFLVESIIISL